MLTKCPECDLQVSDKAISCPHCGYPLKQTTCNKRSKPKRMKLPNGFGQITELKTHRLRKPFRVMVTVGKNENGRPICKTLQPVGYFETYNEAYAALMEYNRDPYTHNNQMLVRELYEKWTEKYFKNASASTIRATQTAWHYCDSVKDLRVSELRGRHIKYCIEEGTYTKNGEEKHPSAHIRVRIKGLFNNMLDYAVEYEMIEKNYARAFAGSKEDMKEILEKREKHIPYTDEEMKKLWTNRNINPIIDMILIQCYTGWRPKELELLKISDIDFDAKTMTGGIKTKAGKNRLVPIHSKILPLVQKQYENSLTRNSEYLFTLEGQNPNKNYTFRYYQYSTNLKLIVDELGLNPNHKPHDGRAHFITQAKKYKVDDFAIKRIVGHEIDDVTEAIYTTRELPWFLSEIEKIM